MSTNISKKKRDDLLDKIKQIRAFIAAAPQDENTGNLLSYLSELEKDVNGKKYGLVFEEHREEIDEVLDTHTPVLTEDADLFIDHGGQMNFLLEGDNLAALKLLEKTHRGNIDLIFIDPPYNTRNGDFGYDDSRVDLTDTFRHSKWVSFMSERLLVARRLLKNDGVLAGALIFNIGNEETIRSTFSEFVNVQINVVAILVSFSVAIISILVTADNANTKSLKEEMADSTQYKPVGGKQLSLFQILLSNIAYNVIVEIIYLVILIGIALIRPIIPLQALKYVAAVCIFAIMHILGVLLESVAQMYLTFWRNR